MTGLLVEKWGSGPGWISCAAESRRSFAWNCWFTLEKLLYSAYRFTNSSFGFQQTTCVAEVQHFSSDVINPFDKYYHTDQRQW